MKMLTTVTINKRYSKDGTLGLTRCGLVCYFRRSIVTSTINIGKHVDTRWKQWRCTEHIYLKSRFVWSMFIFYMPHLLNLTKRLLQRRSLYLLCLMSHFNQRDLQIYVEKSNEMNDIRQKKSKIYWPPSKIASGDPGFQPIWRPS